MKKISFLAASLILGLVVIFGSLNVSATQLNVNKVKCEKFINLSREALENENLSLAQAYAKKAIQANAWSKIAWAAYDDVVQRMADNDELSDFGAVVEKSEINNAPKPSSGAVQLEGC